MRNYPHLGIQVPDILIPNSEINMQKWAVIACDQFTSQPEYWQKVAEKVDDAPSTLHMVLPEVMLGTPQEAERIETAQKTMKNYLALGLLQPYEGMVYVERTINGKTRHGLILALDLEQYDYNKGSKTLIRATEGTIIDRLPPRMRIRRGAALEMPHILVLIDDPDGAVVKVAEVNVGRLQPIYDFELMLGSGHVRGYLVNDPAVEEQIVKGLEKLAEPEAYEQKYGLKRQKDILLFAMGDGNHSLATAKAIWEELKPSVGMDHPARYALVEIENVHDEGLSFEPIHRVLFGVKPDLLKSMQKYFGRHFRYEPVENEAAMVEAVQKQALEGQVIGVILPEGYGLAVIDKPQSNLPAGTLQAFLDDYLEKGNAGKIDYVHGEAVVSELGRQAGNAGFFLPVLEKSDLFKTVILDGALPRKTFSMGEAEEKRFYVETRRIA